MLVDDQEHAAGLAKLLAPTAQLIYIDYRNATYITVVEDSPI